MRNILKGLASLTLVATVVGVGCDLSDLAIPGTPETPVTGVRGVNVYNCSQNYADGTLGVTYSVWVTAGHVVEAAPADWIWAGDVNALNPGDQCGSVGSNYSAITFDLPGAGDWTVSAVQQTPGCNSGDGNHSGCLSGQYSVRQYTQNSSGEYDSFKVQ